MESVRPIAPSWFVASDPKTLELVARAAGIAALESPVLITGESGAGRHTLARLLQSFRPGAAAPCVTISEAQPAAGPIPYVLDVPPLRERPGDLLPLAKCFVSRAAERLGRAALPLSSAAAQALRAYPWPGNAIELEAVLVRALLAARKEIEPEHLALNAELAQTRLATLERNTIERTLLAAQGNRTHAARMLGISVRTLQYRLKEYGIRWEGFAETKAKAAAGML